MNGNSKVRLVAAVAATALAALAVTSSNAIAAKPKPPACQSAIVSLGAPAAGGAGLQLYTHTVCGRRVGIPFG
jgi:hypothetical protein